MKEIKINMNQLCKVKLDTKGIRKIEEDYERHGLQNVKLKLDEHGYYETQLWCLFEYFGDEFRLGNNHPPFMNIIMLESEAK